MRCCDVVVDAMTAVRVGAGRGRESWCAGGWGGKVPVEDGAFGSARDEDRVDGMPC